MRKCFCLVFTLLSVVWLHAQHKVTFILREKTAISHDSIYVTGTFSNWDSTANKNYLLQPHGEREKSITLKLNPGIMRYKFHRGSWLTVEKTYNGTEVLDRVVNINKDTIFTDVVASWRDELLSDKRYALQYATSEADRVSIMAALAMNYAFTTEVTNRDSAFKYAQDALQLQQKIMSSGDRKEWAGENQTKRLIDLQEIIASLLHSLGNYPKALEIRLENLKLAEKEKDQVTLLNAIRNTADDYLSMKDYHKVLFYGQLMDSIIRTGSGNDSVKFQQWSAIMLTANAYYQLKLLDPALYHAKRMFERDLNATWTLIPARVHLLLGDIYSAKGNVDSGFFHYRMSIPFAASTYAFQVVSFAQAGMARLFQKQGRIDSALFYAKHALNYFQNSTLEIQSWGENSDTYLAEISPLVAELYKANNQPDSAYKYLLLSVTLKDSLYNTDRVRQFQTLGFNETVRRQQLEQQSREAKQKYDTRVKMYALVAGMLAVALVAFMLYRNNKHKQKANTLLQLQKQEIETTLGELRNTQKQLIQAEKMASLGELTAGIAHEIQNPLNFVNNFSEVNKELLTEMKEEMDKGNLDDAKAIANDVIENEEKINHHGKRADSIVKGMLQHSRSSSGQKEPTDINALADEYLRLAYHGLRAKDKSFNATMKTDFDESIGSFSIIPQDIGRVILNLINNAFYAVDEKKKQMGDEYDPTVSVGTKKSNGKVTISVMDNGKGIPQKVLGKIFQPFFTTKPTGQGTGLGLSLAYDIVKAHDGELKVETKENEGTLFIIELPVKEN